MKNTKRVTYTLPKSDIRFINTYSVDMKMNKSNFISLCIEECLPLMEEELEDKKIEGYDTPYMFGKKFHNTFPITITLPIDLVEKIDFYSKEIGIKKSHLVFVSIHLMMKKKESELSDFMDELMDSIKFTKKVVEN